MSTKQKQQAFVEERPGRRRCRRMKKQSYSDSEEGDYWINSDKEEVNAGEYREFCQQRGFRGGGRRRRRMNCQQRGGGGRRRRMFFGMPPHQLEGVEQPQCRRMQHCRRRRFRQMAGSGPYGRCRSPQYAGGAQRWRGQLCARKFTPFFEGPRWGRGQCPHPQQFFCGPWGKKGFIPQPQWFPGFW